MEMYHKISRINFRVSQEEMMALTKKQIQDRIIRQIRRVTIKKILQQLNEVRY